LNVVDDLKLGLNAATLLKTRYLLRDKDGKVAETPSELFRRVAKAIAKVDKKYDKDADIKEVEEIFYRMMTDLDFLPNAPTMYNAGTDLGLLSACFVLPIEDDLRDIFETIAKMAVIAKAGGGTGFSFSRLRPKGDVVGGTAGTSSGPVSFMRVYNAATESIKQGGRRRGANMAVLRCVAKGTMISTLNGLVPIENLVDTKPYVYCTDGRRIYIRQAESVISTGHKKVVKILFDDDTSLRCTDDHEIMLSGGGYIKAYGLRLGDSVGILRKYMSNGRRRLVFGGFESIGEHYAVCEMKYGKYPSQNSYKRGPNDLCIHHKDGNILNNNPENIELMTISEHTLMHIDSLLEQQELIANRRKGKSLEEVYGIEKANEWRKHESHARHGKKPWNKDLMTDEYKSHYEKGFGNQYINHKVISVEDDGYEDVYDITVPEFHNFVANGIFVHNCDHPDILEFINCKTDLKELTNFNISVAITDKFMEAYQANEEYDLINPRTKQVTSRLSARLVMDQIAYSAWRTGDPGVFFIDRANKLHPIKNIEVEATNPCGEVILMPWESCNLGSINLYNMVKDGEVDWAKLRSTITKAVHFLDNVIDANKYPFADLEIRTKGARKIGLGVMGWAEMLALMGIPYDSDKAIELAKELSEFIYTNARKASAELAKIRGNFEMKEDSRIRAQFQRNATVMSIAPTGEISIIAGTSAGIEPFFGISYVRVMSEGVELTETNRTFKQMAEKEGFWSDDLAIDIARSGSVQDIDAVPMKMKRLFRLNTEIDPIWHVKMQAAWQEHVDNAVSKTVQLPEDSTPEDIKDIYVKAYDFGCKGITVYREGSRGGERVIFKGKKMKKTENNGVVKCSLEEEAKLTCSKCG
jgi:ribonucleotide reductase alpha subunit